MKNYSIYEGDNAYNTLQTNPDIIVGDTIEYSPNNQMGYEKYEVILGENGEKKLKLIDSYDLQQEALDYKGGKKTRKRKGRKSRKSRKNRKSRKSRKSRKGRKGRK